MNSWDRYCRYFFFYPSVGLSLDLSRMRFQEGFFEEMEPRIQGAYRAMTELERGALSNPDEQRMVGHYWLRAPEKAPTAELSQAITDSLAAILAFSRRVHQGEITTERGERFTRILLVGIGGSALGPQLVADCLGGDALQISFCDNTDPDGIRRTLHGLGNELETTIIIVTSKSGNTVETHNASLEIQSALRDRGRSFAKQAVAVTVRGSKLHARAEEEGWLGVFEMWDWVGGRTSLFSAVGLLPAALQGVAIEELLSGARVMDELTSLPVTEQNPAALLALMWFFATEGRGTKSMVVLPYKDRLAFFSRYLQQLIMESLGKERDLDGNQVFQGLTVFGNKGSTDQHAYVQQLRDGLNNFFVTFLQVLEDYGDGLRPTPEVEVLPKVHTGDYLNGFLLGTRTALSENGRDSVTIALDRLDTKTLGALIALYERAVGLYASLIHINAYHQPGVEAGKKAAERVVRTQQSVLEFLAQHSDQEFTVEAVAKGCALQGEEETVFQVLEHLAANGAYRVKRCGTRTPKDSRYRLG